MTQAIFHALGTFGVMLTIISPILFLNYVGKPANERTNFHIWASITTLVIGPVIATFFFTLAQEA